jgi:mono/diheme cytochrome c family protein
MGCIKAIFWLAILGVIAGVILMFSGVIDVAATTPHNPVTEFVLSTTMDNSVRYHAKGIEAPPLDNHAMIQEGFSHYHEMCEACHLAPGIDPTEISQGLLPAPPDLKEAAEEWAPAELFWVIKNGVKMTGMPAWGPTHSDDKLWAIVAFVKKLPETTAAQYAEMERAAGPDQHDGDEQTHEHTALPEN